ncbi:MAG: DUF4345 family protein [Trueperaceae bacterium]
MTTRTQLAYAAAGVVLLLGLLSLFNPVLATRLLGLEIAAPRGLSEVRATYGALFVTMAALLLWALPQRPRGAIVVRAMGILWAGVAAGRIASMAIDDGTLTVGNVASLAVAAVVAVLLLWGSLETPPTAAEAASRREAAAARRAAGRAKRESAAARARLAKREGAGDA